MITYKDMTFCPFYWGCGKRNCSRALTAEVREDARKSKLPISQFVDKPECFKENKWEDQQVSTNPRG